MLLSWAPRQGEEKETLWDLVQLHPPTPLQSCSPHGLPKVQAFPEWSHPWGLQSPSGLGNTRSLTFPQGHPACKIGSRSAGGWLFLPSGFPHLQGSQHPVTGQPIPTTLGSINPLLSGGQVPWV